MDQKKGHKDFYNLKSSAIKKLVSEIKRNLNAAEKRNDYKKIANCKVELEKLGNHPSRFYDLLNKLDAGKVKLEASKQISGTIMVALELASKYQQLSDQNLKLNFEKIELLQIGTAPEVPYQKRLTVVGRILGLTKDSKGKKEFWTPPRLARLKEVYEGLIGSGLARRDAVLEIFKEPKNKGLFSSPNQCGKMLRKAGLTKIPNMAYLSKTLPKVFPQSRLENF